MIQRSGGNADSRFAVVSPRHRCWAIGAVHGRAETLGRLHAELARRLRAGDALVYLGNLMGPSPAVRATIDEALRFRCRVLALPGSEPEDVVFLRGGQEEMWHKLLQIQFAPNPGEVLEWMLAHGVTGTLESYGGNAAQGRDAARRGAVALSEWTTRLRGAMRRHDGHVAFMSALKRSAYTHDHRLLFVSAGLDPSRPLSEQNDSFWWGGREFEAMDSPYSTFGRVVRGFDVRRRGVHVRPHAISLDGGCGFGGTLAAMAFDRDGEIADRIDVDDGTAA